MKRPIKFKAQRVSDGEWVEGSLIQRIESTEIHDSVFTWVIDSNTICQFTGLTDMNGKEGYYYDRVLSPIYGEGFIQWCDQRAWSFIRFGDEDFNTTMEHLKECEVIGNIHDK